MRVVIQRVTRAAVRVAGETVGAIDRPGYLVLVGITHGDGAAQIAKLADKTANLRLEWRGRSPCSMRAHPCWRLASSPCTGMRRRAAAPSWSAAAPGPVSEPLFNDYVQALRERGLHVETGVFGADMQVELVNDGPVTLILDSETL